MKGVVFTIAILFCLLPASTVYAGSLNEYEREIVAEAKKIYEYQGIRYHVPDRYINQLINYLSQDDVDITAEKRDEALTIAYDSIELGVQEGYLVPIDESEQHPTMEGLDTNKEPSITEEKSDQNEKESKVSTEDSASVKKDNEQEKQAKEIMDNILSEDPVIEAEVDPNSGELPSVIKNTGYCFNHTFIVIVGMIILMIIGIMVAVRCNYFAYHDE